MLDPDTYEPDGIWFEIADPVHPFWHVCKKCFSFFKVAALFVLVDVAVELVTFLPVHRLFEAMGWI